MSATLALLVLVPLLLTLAFGALYAACLASTRNHTTLLIEQINACLPQTQCGQCGHPGCKPYATAIASGTPINRCPPGGAGTIAALAKLLRVTALPLDPTHGVESPRKIAVIREAECIGCTKCIQACPVDAILGSAKHMHTVIESECTGCDLCVDPCPVDCIDMVPAETAQTSEQWPLPALTAQDAKRQRAIHWQRRFEAHQLRIAAETAAAEQRRAERAALVAQKQQAVAAAPSPQDIIAAALARVQAKKAAQQADTKTAAGDDNGKASS